MMQQELTQRRLQEEEILRLKEESKMAKVAATGENEKLKKQLADSVKLHANAKSKLDEIEANKNERN